MSAFANVVCQPDAGVEQRLCATGPLERLTWTQRDLAYLAGRAGLGRRRSSAR